MSRVGALVEWRDRLWLLLSELHNKERGEDFRRAGQSTQIPYLIYWAAKDPETCDDSFKRGGAFKRGLP